MTARPPVAATARVDAPNCGRGMTRQLVPLPKVPEYRAWCSYRLAQRLVSERRIPFHRLGDGPRARVLIDLADLDAYAEAGRVEAAS